MVLEIQLQGFASANSALDDASRLDAIILDGKPSASEQQSGIANAKVRHFRNRRWSGSMPHLIRSNLSKRP